MSANLGKSIALVAVGMLAGGGTATLILKKHYQRILDEEVASVKAAYKDLKKQNLDLIDVVTQPKPVVEKDKPLSEDDILNISAAKLISDHGYGGGVIEEEAPRFKLYDRTTVNFNPADEERGEEEPYVISLAEFSNDEEDFDKITLRYFEEDDTLTEELRKDTPLPIESVGAANLLRFGVGSEDEEIVYVRNEKLKIDFEIVRDEGSYTETALGLPEWNSRDVKDKPRVKKMRNSSD
jgi:hypothetical protein